MGPTFGRGHFPSQEMGPTFGRGHFPSQEMGPTFGRGHFPSQEMGPTFGRGHFPTEEMGLTFGRGHFPSLGRSTPFYFLLLITPPYYLYMYTQRSALRWKGILSILCRAAIVMATVSVPLSGWWGGSHALRRDKLKVQHAQNAREDARQLMRVDIETKWSNLSEAYLQIDLARRSAASATENLRLNRDSYEAGTVPLTDLLDAQTQLRLARDRYTEACTAYCNARTAYRQAVGEQGARIVPEYLSSFAAVFNSVCI